MASQGEFDAGLDWHQSQLTGSAPAAAPATGPVLSLTGSRVAASSMSSADRSITERGITAESAPSLQGLSFGYNTVASSLAQGASVAQGPTALVAERHAQLSPHSSQASESADEAHSPSMGDVTAQTFFSLLEAAGVDPLELPGAGVLFAAGNIPRGDASAAHATPGNVRSTDDRHDPTAREHTHASRKRPRDGDALPMDDSLARLLILQQQHADADYEQDAHAQDGSIPPVFNAGHFHATAHRHGIDARAVAKRILTVLATGQPKLLRRLAQSFGGKLPVNLLQSAAPYLRNHLHALLMSRYRPADVPLRMCSDFVFDGVHLTIMGFVAAIVADSNDEAHATVPRGTVLVAPRFKVHTSQDGGANLTSEIDHGAADETTGASLSPSIFSESDGLRGPSCSLSTLYARWPHLCSIIQSASAEVRSEAQAVLVAEASGRDVDVPDSIAALYFNFLNGTGTACVFWISRAKGMYTSFVGETEAFLRLTGTSHEGVLKYTTNDPDADANNAMQVLHPSNIGRRTLAALTAQNNNLASYTFEGLHLRYATTRVPVAAAPGPEPASTSPPGGQHIPSTAAPRAQIPQDHTARTSEPGDTSARGAAAGDFAQRALYTPFYAMQTMHLDSFPSGKKRMDVVYFHDTVFTRRPVPSAEVSGAAGEVAALENLLLSPALASEVRTAMRRGTTAKGQRVGALEALLTTAVMDMKSRLLKRLTMALSFEQDPLLLAKLASQAQQPVAEDAVLSGAFAPALNGLSLGRLRRLREGIQEGIAPQALHRVRGLLAMILKQEQRNMLIRTGDVPVACELPFPLPSMHKAASRWMGHIHG